MTVISGRLTTDGYGIFIMRTNVDACRTNEGGSGTNEPAQELIRRIGSGTNEPAQELIRMIGSGTNEPAQELIPRIEKQVGQAMYTFVASSMLVACLSK